MEEVRKFRTPVVITATIIGDVKSPLLPPLEKWDAFWLRWAAWWLSAAAAITHAIGTGGLAIASISLWETALLITAGRLLPQGTEEAWLRALVDRSGVVVKQTTPAIALLSARWPADFPRDPADRVIAATPRTEGLPPVPSAARLRRSRLVETAW